VGVLSDIEIWIHGKKWSHLLRSTKGRERLVKEP
jgi:hypothetical protein